jgi:hypothetical protein
MAALTTEQLQCLLDCFVVNTGNALGVFPANFVPIQCEPTGTGRASQVTIQAGSATGARQKALLGANRSCCFVLNTDPSYAPGEHWLAFYYNYNTHKLEYFDSFGFPVSMYPHVNAALIANCLSSICVPANSSGSLQSVQSTVCGHYCVLYLYWRARHASELPSSFARSLLSSCVGPEQRDSHVVASLRALSSRHPCCNSLLGGSGGRASAAPVISQTCCCCNSAKRRC